jgi:DNA-binding transcriptional ArsR family regulator
VPRPRSQPTPDHVDRFLEEFKEEFPAEIDLEIEGIVDRINGINRRLKRALDETLAEYGLSHAAYKVLSSLRWAGAPYRRSAGELAALSDLSSGAMTSRLDQLEKAGLVRRLRDDPESRSATITTFQPLTDTSYIPCVSMLDFWLADGAVELVVYAHSLDFGIRELIKGYTMIRDNKYGNV